MARANRGRSLFALLIYLTVISACIFSLVRSGDFTLGRQPWTNLVKTGREMSNPSFLDIWFGNTRFEYRNDEGQVLRTENRRKVESRFVEALLEAAWGTFRLGTLGSLFAATAALPFGLITARNLGFPRILSMPSKLILDASRSIHTLVFGLLYVGIIGLGPMAGVLAIASHSLGTYGKLYAESIETLDMKSVEAVRATGATRMQVFFYSVWPSILPQLVSTNLYVWEYNIRDSTVLGLVGAGGIGMLVSESTSLFQWGRLTTILIVIVTMVTLFDSISRRLRRELL